MELSYDKDKFKQFCQKYNLSLVILHGSYARRIATNKSDIDIAFLGNPQIIKEKFFDIMSDFASVFGDKFDPVFLNQSDAMIAYRVALYGRPIYEKQKGMFNLFRLGSIARYFDTKKFRLLEKEYLKHAIQKMD